MVTVVKTPQGHKIIDQNITASIIEDYVGDAVVQFPYHGLGTGDYVYIESDIDEYNGFWYVTAVDANQFKISEHSLSDFVEYYQDADIDYYQTQEHEWSSIFLPIVYKIKTDSWPTNELNPERTVLSQSDDNGFTHLILSGALKSSFAALEFVKVGTEVYQIVEVISTSSIVINLAYDASNTFTTVQYYYNNYQVRVKIYAGLPAGHPWEAKKPYTEVAELSLTPDENNEVMFSVADYITQKVAIKNNTLLYSLPLNLDAFTGFYISVGESYDQSDNYSLYTSESPFVDDTFEGYAIAGKLPFKNMYSGDYADYVYTSGSPALWLTLLDRLLAVNDLYFDVSFIKNITGPFHLTVNKYLSSDYFITETLEFEDQGIGVYRIPLEISSTYESYCIQAATESHTETVEVPVVPFDLSTMTNEAAGGDLPDWTLGAIPFILTQDRADNLAYAIALPAGVPVKINYIIRIENKGLGNANFVFETLDAGLNALNSVTVPANSGGTYDASVMLPGPPSGVAYLTLTFDNGGGGPVWDMYLDYLSIGDPTTEEVIVPGVTVTEEICIDIIDDCQSADQFVADNIRELEDGNYRLLE